MVCSVSPDREVTLSELREYPIGAMVRGISATDGESSSRVDFLALLSLLGGAKLLALRDGMASYPERLAQDVEVELGAEVLAIETAAGGVSITSVDAQGIRSVRQAAGCVVAVEGEVAARIMPGLDSWRRCYLQQIINKPLLVVNIGLADRPAMDTTCVMVPASAESFITGVMLDHQKAPGASPRARDCSRLRCWTAGLVTIGIPRTPKSVPRCRPISHESFPGSSAPSSSPRYRDGT